MSRRTMFQRLGLAAAGLFAARPLMANAEEAGLAGTTGSTEPQHDLGCAIEIEQSAEGIEVDLYLANHTANAIEVVHKRSGRVASHPMLEATLGNERFELRKKSINEFRPMPRVIRIRHLTLPTGVAVHYGRFSFPWPEDWQNNTLSGQQAHIRAHFTARTQDNEHAITSERIAMTLPDWSTTG